MNFYRYNLIQIKSGLLKFPDYNFTLHGRKKRI